MITVYIAVGTPPDKLQKIEAHLAHAAQRNVGLNGVEFRIERDDFTWLDGEESPDKVELMYQILKSFLANETPL